MRPPGGEHAHEGRHPGQHDGSLGVGDGAVGQRAHRHHHRQEPVDMMSQLESIILWRSWLLKFPVCHIQTMQVPLFIISTKINKSFLISSFQSSRFWLWLRRYITHEQTLMDCSDEKKWTSLETFLAHKNIFRLTVEISIYCDCLRDSIVSTWWRYEWITVYLAAVHRL